MADELVEMDKGGDGEKDGEEDGCCLGRVVSIVCPDSILVVGAVVCCLSSPKSHFEYQRGDEARDEEIGEIRGGSLLCTI
jgi:hypothetical protein